MEGIVYALALEHQAGFPQAENYLLSLFSAPFLASLHGWLRAYLMDSSRGHLNP